MGIIHPSYCDPAACTPMGGDVLHKSETFTMRVGDVLAAVGLCRLDDLGAFGHVGRDSVRLRLFDLESAHEDGGDVEVSASFDAAQARLLAAALLCAADQLDEAVPA